MGPVVTAPGIGLRRIGTGITIGTTGDLRWIKALRASSSLEERSKSSIKRKAKKHDIHLNICLFSIGKKKVNNITFS